MGEIADMILDSIYDNFGGEDSDPDLYINPNPINYKVCRNCKEGGLEWGTQNGKWRLARRTRKGKLEIHNCFVKPLKENP